MPKNIWMNPHYEPVGDDKHIDYEACFSVGDSAGPMARYKTILYQAYLVDGTKVVNTRLIMSMVYTNYVREVELVPLDEYRRRMRKEAMEKG